MKKKEIIILGIIVMGCLLAILLLFSGGKALGAEIICQGRIVKTIKLENHKANKAAGESSDVFSVEGLEQVVFQVKGGAIAFIESDCADQICVKAGFINGKGQMAACLPNQISIRILTGDKKAPDIIR